MKYLTVGVMNLYNMWICIYIYIYIEIPELFHNILIHCNAPVHCTVVYMLTWQTKNGYFLSLQANRVDRVFCSKKLRKHNTYPSFTQFSVSDIGLGEFSIQFKISWEDIKYNVGLL